MSDLDTSAYTPAHEAEEQRQPSYLEDQEEEEQRTRFEVPLDQAQKPRLDKTIQKLDEILREDTEAKEKLEELKQVLQQYDSRRFLNNYIYECNKCGESFDTKQGAGVHRAMNPNCDRTEPWTRSFDNLEEQFNKIEVDEYYGENTEN